MGSNEPVMTQRSECHAPHSARFDGRIAIVTGAASGMGKAVTARLVTEGCRVTMVDSNTEALGRVAAEFGPAVLVVPADVTDESQVRGYVDATLEAFGRIDHFFNNAGIAGRTGPLVQLAKADLDAAMAVNVYGAFFGLREVLREMERQGTGGTVVNTASTSSVRSVPGTTPYVVTKHAMAGLTLAGALDAAPYGVRVNAVAPGGVDTPLLRCVLRERDDIGQAKAAMTERIPLGRLGRPEEIANLVVWLLSDESSYVTGAIYLVDGGLRAS